MERDRDLRTADAAVATVAERQLGLFTWEQALDAGWYAQLLAARCRAGRVRRVAHGVYVFVGTPDSWERRLLAAVLATGPNAVASHESAAALHGFTHVAPRERARISVALSRDLDAQRRVQKVHRVLLPPDHTTQIDCIPVTCFMRTLVDMSGHLDVPELAKNLDLGIVQGAVDLGRLHAMLDELGPAPGRRVRRLRRLLAQRGVEAHRAESVKEIRLLRVLRAARVPVPVPQYRVTVAGTEYRFDGAYPDHRIGLEYLGWDPHRTRSAFDHDFKRDRLLSLDGWSIYYFTSASSDAEIVATVTQALARTARPDAASGA